MEIKSLSCRGQVATIAPCSGFTMEDRKQVGYRNVKKGLVAADFEGTQAGRVVAR